MAIKLGSEVGTTIKLFIASIKGSAVKKRVALGNFLINIITVTLIFFLLLPVNRLITDVIGIKDNLIALVFFQTFINLIGILLFYPLLNVMGRFLEKRFRVADEETMFIHKVDTKEPSMALYAMEQEDRHFIAAVCDYILDCFGMENKLEKDMKLNKRFADQNLSKKYEYIKFLYGEIHSYYIRLRETIKNKDDSDKGERLMSSVRNTMYAAKSFKDAVPDKDELHNSSNETKYAFYRQTKEEVKKFCESVQKLLMKEKHDSIDEVAAVYKSVTGGYTDTLKHLYQEGTAKHVSENEITTLLNFNREIFTGYKSLFFGIKDLLFDREQSKELDELPGFIR